jgi:D-sedoheptulose 7-phosphate isomerase
VGSFLNYVKSSIDLFEQLKVNDVHSKIEDAIEAISSALSVRGPVLVCGNGGSASDAMHIAGELVGRYLKERPAYNAIALSTNPAVLTAWANDYEYETIFSHQVEAHAQKGGVLIGISTSGNSENVVNAMETAQEQGMAVVALTGKEGGLCARHSDILIDVPSQSTPRIQEMHICIYHYLCERVEATLTRTQPRQTL